MADGSYRFQQGAGQQYFYPQHHNYPRQIRDLHQRPGSPTSTARIGFNDTDSPSRSPGPQSPAHNQHSMYNQPHGQHAYQNGTNTHARYMPMNVPKSFQHQNQSQHHHGHQHQQHQEHGGHGGHNATFPTHQHNISSGGLSAATPHFTSNHLQNGTPGSSHAALNKQTTEEWGRQIQRYEQSRSMVQAHPYARSDPRVSKNVGSGSINGVQKEVGKEERNRAADHNEESEEDLVWHALDLAGCNLKVMAPPMFEYTFLTKLYFNHNKLTYLPPAIGRLRNLTHLDLSLNQIQILPPEIGMLVNLRELLLFDNNVSDLPYEMGTLYQLQLLGIEGNPLNEELRNIIEEYGTTELIKHLREHSEEPPPPRERDWVEVVNDQDIPAAEKFSVLSYNTLCDKYATQSQYGYTPSAALAWDRRKELILAQLRHQEADIVCLQEMDSENFNEYFRGELAHNDYKGVFWPKPRARTMAEREAKQVDGCATFYKNSKYILLDKQLVDFANTAINRPDMKGEHDIFNRVMPKDNIAVVTFLENRQTGARIIVANAHIYWDPVFKDVKVVQVAILMEHITKLAENYAKWPACTDKVLYRYTNGDKEDDDETEELPEEEMAPSMEYPSGPSIPLIMCGDFNSMKDSGVYDLISHGSLPHSHPDLGTRKYGNFTRDGMSHPFSLKSSYSHIGELDFTNYTPGFTGVIDYIWYSMNSLQVTALLGNVDPEYLKRVPGFPNYHFPSDHLALVSHFAIKGRKEKKVTEADFGPQRDSRRN